MSSQPDRTFAQLYLAAAELETLRDLVARRLVEVGQPIKEPELPDDVGLLWSLHTCMAEARYQVDDAQPIRHRPQGGSPHELEERQAKIKEIDRIFGDLAVGFTRSKDMNLRLIEAIREIMHDVLQPLDTAGIDDLPILRAAATKLDVRLQEIIDDPLWGPGP